MSRDCRVPPASTVPHRWCTEPAAAPTAAAPVAGGPGPIMGTMAALAAPTTLLILATILALLLCYSATVASLAATWQRSATFAHGAVIAPISAWLVWRQRARLVQLPLAPAPWALVPLLILGLCWLAAALAMVQVVQQFCLVLIIICAVVAIVGVPYSRAIAFPLAFLLLAVPFGEVLIPTLIELTTTSCVTVLQLAGIPVFRENNYLVLPTGNWSVVEACSGLRYLIASVAMGSLYAHLHYRSWYRRTLFMLASLAIPLLANGLRAVLIILLGHYSDMRLALGVDHLLYGWLFFGVVTLLLFWCAARWRDTAAAPVPASAARPAGMMENGRMAGKSASGQAAPAQAALVPAALAPVALAVLLCGAVWPALYLAATVHEGTSAPRERRLQLPALPPPWRAQPLTPQDWQALHRGTPLRWSAKYGDGSLAVTLQLIWYPHQRGHDDLLAPVPRQATPGLPDWQSTPMGSTKVAVNGRALDVRVITEQAVQARLRVWRWYRHGSIDTDSAVLLKLLLARARVSGDQQGVAEIIVAAPEDDLAPAERPMTALLAAALPLIDEALRDVGRP